MNRIIIYIAASLQAMTVTSFSQTWGPMQYIFWDNPPPAYPGFFNPSYCQSESLLYFDTYYRHFPDEGAIIYTSKLDSVQYDQLRWADPEPLPEPINLPGYRNAMPSISHSGDTLFFCSDRPRTRGGLDLWMSVKTDNIWGDPINLGDSVNGPFDEFAPNYASSIGFLFFDTRDSSSNFSKIYSCRSNGDNTWGVRSSLPPIINIPGNYTHGPFFDDGGQALYFTSADFQWDEDSIAKSEYLNGNWGNPVELSDNVNGFWYPNICNLVTTENPSIGSDGLLLFYNKWIWEAVFCIDFYSYLFYSELSTSIIEERPVDILIYNIKIHPNPSNSQFLIHVENYNQPYILKIYNMRGRLVKRYNASREPVNEWGGTGYDGLTVSSGIYFAVASIDDHKLVKKMVFIK